MNGPVATLTWKRRTLANTYVTTPDVYSYSLAPTITCTRTNGTLRLTWLDGGTLESAPDISGGWTAVANGRSPYTVTSLAEAARFYRVRLR